MRAMHQDRIVCSYNVRCPLDHIPIMLRVLVSQPWQRESTGREMGATCRVNTARGRVDRGCRNRKAIKLLLYQSQSCMRNGRDLQAHGTNFMQSRGLGAKGGTGGGWNSADVMQSCSLAAIILAGEKRG